MHDKEEFRPRHTPARTCSKKGSPEDALAWKSGGQQQFRLDWCAFSCPECPVAGLEGLTASDILGNLEILSNNLLADISALEAVLGCQANGSTAIVPPAAQVGAIEVLPADPATPVSRCLLTTAEQVTSSPNLCSCTPHALRLQDCVPGT